MEEKLNSCIEHSIENLVELRELTPEIANIAQVADANAHLPQLLRLATSNIIIKI
jgi:hypothetical protein